MSGRCGFVRFPDPPLELSSESRNLTGCGHAGGLEEGREGRRWSRRKEENINCGSAPAHLASLEPALRMVSMEESNKCILICF